MSSINNDWMYRLPRFPPPHPSLMNNNPTMPPPLGRPAHARASQWRVDPSLMNNNPTMPPPLGLWPATTPPQLLGSDGRGVSHTSWGFPDFLGVRQASREYEAQRPGVAGGRQRIDAAEIDEMSMDSEFVGTVGGPDRNVPDTPIYYPSYSRNATEARALARRAAIIFAQRFSSAERSSMSAEVRKEHIDAIMMEGALGPPGTPPETYLPS